MTRSVAIVSPRGISGGVRTTVSKLAEGLEVDGLSVQRVEFPNISPPTRIRRLLTVASSVFEEMVLCKDLKDFDTVIYMGSIAYLSHLLFFVPKKALVIHGFVQQEWTNWIQKNEHLVGRAFIKARLRYWQLFNSNPSLNELDFLVCRSETNAEANRIHGDHVILPNYVLPREVEAYKTMYESYKERITKPNEVRVLCYLSTVESPRLLTREQITRLYNLLTKQTTKKVKFVLIDPLSPKTENNESDSFRVLPYVSNQEWTRLILSSDLFLDTCTDEELRNGPIEAGLIGVPFAKVTYPQYSSRQDYGANEVLTGGSVPELVERLATFCNELEYFRPRYSQSVREFVTNNRSWDCIKGPLLKRII